MQDRQSFKYIYMHLQALHANLLDPGILFSQNLSSPVHSVLINTIGQQTTHKNFNHPAQQLLAAASCIAPIQTPIA